MLGKNQLKQLVECAGWARHKNVVLRITIGRKMRYTRETGGGYPVTVEMYYTDVDPPERDLSASIARCQHEYTAIDKAREVARHLVELGVDRDRVSITKS